MFTHHLNLTAPPEGTPDECIVHGWSLCGQVATRLTAGDMRAAITVGNTAPPLGCSPCPACVHVMSGMTIGPEDCTCEFPTVDNRGYVLHTQSITTVDHNSIVELIDAETCPAERRALIRCLIARDGSYVRGGVTS
jgi:hypothetical protein